MHFQSTHEAEHHSSVDRSDVRVLHEYCRDRNALYVVLDDSHFCIYTTGLVDCRDCNYVQERGLVFHMRLHKDEFHRHRELPSHFDGDTRDENHAHIMNE